MTLPSFLIIGAPRCGTTFLVKNLRFHPDIFIPEEGAELGSEDVHFFDNHTEKGSTNFSKGLSWYRSLFQSCGEHQVPGEKTADYLCSEESAELILDTLGSNTKLIVVIRDPVSRAYSHYLHSRHRLPMGLSFKHIVEIAEDPQGVPVLSAGLYWKHLKPYFDRFPASNILILLNDDLESSPENELIRICRFLGVREDIVFGLSDSRINVSSAGFVSHFSARAGRALKALLPGFHEWLMTGLLSRYLGEAILWIRGKSDTPDSTYSESPKEVGRDTIDRLRNYYQHDVAHLSTLLERDLAKLWWNQ